MSDGKAGGTATHISPWKVQFIVVAAYGDGLQSPGFVFTYEIADYDLGGNIVHERE